MVACLSCTVDDYTGEDEGKEEEEYECEEKKCGGYGCKNGYKMDDYGCQTCDCAGEYQRL